ncbi:hypothetical protein C8Q74DRAFT_346184 [Fomes fomentarius]|nr:hypothetical protein C8Q74DRAFT_346184 [Fomes fomentarius]
MSDKFTIAAPPSTDIWREPPSTNRFNALTHPLLARPVPLKSFQRARITFSAPWTTRYDHAGLLLHLKHPDQPSDRWLKTGAEFYLNQVFISTVATQTWSDWSVTQPADASGGRVTIELRREPGDEPGTKLWVYELVLGSDGQVKERRPLREVAWFFAEEDGWQLEVSAMAARPASKETVVGSAELVVSFEGAEVEVA